MKGLIKKIEDAMAAVAFAEAGEFETARNIMKEQPPLSESIVSLKRKFNLSIDDLTAMAITYAEAGEHEKALEILKEAEEKLKTVNRDILQGFLVNAKNTN